MTIQCAKCEEHLELEKFYKSRQSWCKNCIKLAAKKSYLKNQTTRKESMRTYNKLWYSENKEKRQKQINQYQISRRKMDVNYKLAFLLRTRLCNALKGNLKKSSILTLLGCSVSEFKAYMESKFKPGMNWENHGQKGWHIDHIEPISRFDLSDLNQLQKACHYSNMQPLWATENHKKGASYAG